MMMRPKVSRMGAGRMGALAAGLAAVLAMGVAGGGCGTTEPARLDPVAWQLAGNGRSAYERGAYAQAARFYEQALQRARSADDGPEIARNAYNLAACQLRLGQPAAARVLLREALAEFGRARMDSQPAFLLDAKAAQAAGSPDAAMAALDAAYQACKTDVQRREVLQLRGEWAADREDGEAARAALEASRRFAGRDESDALRAADRRLAGRVARLDDRPGDAARLFDEAAAAWQRARLTADLAASLALAGEAWQAAGDAAGAADRHYRAARSYYAQGYYPDALRQVEAALAANADTGDAGPEALLMALFEEIRRDLPASP